MDGTAWSALGSGVNSYSNQVNALAVDRTGGVYAGGYFTVVGGKPLRTIAKWTGGVRRFLWLPLVLR